MNYVLGLVTAFSFGVGSPVLWAESPTARPEHGGHKEAAMGDKISGEPLQAWATVQQLVKDMETAVQSKNLHGIHDLTMKIRAPIKTLREHGRMLSGDKGLKITAAVKQLDSAVTDLHSAADNGSQAEAETALKSVESALDQLKAQDPEAAFKNMP